MDFFRFLDTTTDKNGTNLLFRLSIKYTYKTGVHDNSLILSRYLPGSKIPTSKFSESKEVRWGPCCP
ncbi:hypothetical protein GBN78_07035 [Bacillus sp. B2-WWTP-C-10-Post-4]|uniref:Uncharacterized protein n=1 Tax=Bacillus cereus TaxID=1396 RepID=A0A9X7LWV4_BACCE|nr:hypothetical protein GBN78_07035 [Bacillus sp. B2-WWTP-C-10-Post-4]PEW72111.1 hypothetical protein CN448_07200 [Bacillus cereus]QDZ74388.1 hypothetical protein D0437_15395 [Bacillus cereus]